MMHDIGTRKGTANFFGPVVSVALISIARFHHCRDFPSAERPAPEETREEIDRKIKVQAVDGAAATGIAGTRPQARHPLRLVRNVPRRASDKSN